MVCVDCIDLSTIDSIALGKEVFGGKLKLVMKSKCDAV